MMTTDSQMISRRALTQMLSAAGLSGLIGINAHAQQGQTPGASLSQATTAQPLSAIENVARVWASSERPYQRLASQIYTANRYQLFWHDGQRWTPAARGVFRALSEAMNVGLDAEDYLGEVQVRLSSAGSQQDIAILDALITAGSMRYYFDANLGIGNSADPYGAQQFFVGLLPLDEPRAYQALLARNPSDRLFEAMAAALATRPLTPAQRQQILVNMHRARVEEYEPFAGKQVVVDLGLQQLHAYDNNRLIRAMDVVVGKPERRTPILRDRIVSLKFSPDWTVPQTIAREDLVPIMLEDPSIVEDLGLSVRNASGQDVDMASLDWAKYLGRNFPYTFYQKPGMKNLLGGVRFSLTNDQAIYMHDSPDIDAFDTGTRAFSSGCVRVADAASLATWIMSDEQNWNEQQVVSAMISGRTNTQRLRQPVKVLFTYSTITLNQRGELVLMPDIYGEDAALAKTLGV